MEARSRRPPPDGPHPNDSRNPGPPRGGGGRPRRGPRTAILSVAGVLVLAAVAVGVLWSSLSLPERTAPNARPGGGAPGRGSAAGPSGAAGPSITGTITVAPELSGRVGAAHVLFIIARRGPGPPFAVKRIPEPRLPLSYRLGSEDVMMAGVPFEGEVSLSARLSLAGAAGPAQPGDLEGAYPGQVTVGQRGVDIVINRVH